MKITSFLAPTDVLADVAASDKPTLLRALARRAGAVVHVSPDVILSELLKREELGSTGMGGGVAIPHARFHELDKPYGLFARLKRPVDFDAVDGRPIDLVCLLLLPDAPAGEQLGALACTARKLTDPASLAALRLARDAAEISRALAAD